MERADDCDERYGWRRTSRYVPDDAGVFDNEKHHQYGDEEADVDEEYHHCS